MDKRVCVKWTKVFSWIHVIIHCTQIRAHVESMEDSPRCVWKSSTCKKKFLVTQAENMQEEKKPHYQQRSISFTVSYLERKRSAPTVFYSFPFVSFFLCFPHFFTTVMPKFLLLLPRSFPQTISCLPFLLASLKGYCNSSNIGWNRLDSVHTSSWSGRLSSLG